MPPSLRGALFAGLNVLVVATLLATLGPVVGGPAYYNASGTFLMICMFTAMPALVGGAVIGMLAARVTRFRRTIIVASSVALVVALGIAFDARNLISLACAPTFVIALWFEHTTRNERPGPLTATAKGVVLALVATGATAVLAVLDGARSDLIGSISIFGTLPAALVGLCSGTYAGAVVTLRPAARLAILIPVVLTIALGAIHVMCHSLVVPALVPTVIATALLERWTRRRELIPIARAV